jgi:HEAT repeat protein
LLRQLLDNPSNSVRLSAILGVGLARDQKSIDNLIKRMTSGFPVEGQVAAIALVLLGTRPALDAVASMLLHGSDEMRRAAAEALALEPDEGHLALKEAVVMEDVHLRRAAVYGLGRLDQPWANEILEKLQLEDKEWVVRSAAAEALEQKKANGLSIPKPLPPLWEAAWMIEFAAKQGMGITPGKPAQNLLMQALKSGEVEHKLAAMETLRVKPDAGAVPTLYGIFYGPQGELQDAACETIWNFAAAGIELPPPARFGLGV